MKTIDQINEDEAKTIACLVGEQSSGFRIKKENEDEDEKEQHVVINIGINQERIKIFPTGRVLFCDYDLNIGEVYGSGNTLPITDYLRKKGYEFKY